METNVNYTLIGAFVIVMFMAITLAIIWLSSGFSYRQYSTYLVYMQESVSGLSMDSPVEYNGVIVGRVKKIELNHKNPQLVELLLSITTTTPITKGTVATLNSRGITGVTFVALKDKSTDLRKLVAERGQPYPVIPTAPSIYVRLETALTQLTKTFKQISESIQTLLDKENQASIKKTLSNLRDITTDLSANTKKFDTIMTNAALATKELTPLLQSSTGAMRTLQRQTLPSANQVIMNLDDISRNLTETARILRQNPSAMVRGVQHQPLGPGE